MYCLLMMRYIEQILYIDTGSAAVRWVHSIGPKTVFIGFK